MRLIRYVKRNHQKIQERIDILTSDFDFQKSVKELRKKWRINFRKASQQIEKLLWDKEFDLQVTKLMKDFRLHEQWRDWLYKYLIFNKVDLNFDPGATLIEEGRDKEADPITNEPVYSIRVNSNTTDEDLKMAKRTIRKLQGAKTKRQRTGKNSKRDKRIYELASKGKDIIEIDKIVNKEFNEDLDFGYIKTIVSRVRIKTNLPRNRKLKTNSEVQVSFKKLFK